MNHTQLLHHHSETIFLSRNYYNMSAYLSEEIKITVPEGYVSAQAGCSSRVMKLRHARSLFLLDFLVSLCLPRRT
jgi:hypothetical protein